MLIITNAHQGGLYMYFDGELVADSSRCDEFWMTAFWMEGFKGLLEGSWKASAMPWEESQMKLCFFEDRRRLILKGAKPKLTSHLLRIPTLPLM